MNPLSLAGAGRMRFLIIAFALAGFLIAALVTWQLFETNPARWCAIAANGSPEITTGCYQVLLKLLEIKQTSLVMLISVLGLTILSLTAVALGVRIKAEGVGGMNVDVGPNTTTVATPDTTVTLPTPPADGSDK